MVWLSLLKDLIFILALSLIPALLSYFLDFALGFPGKEEEPGPNVHSIFSGWILYLAKRRLKSIPVSSGSIKSLYTELIEGLSAQLATESTTIKNMAQKMLKKSIIIKAREFITWENAAGYCIFCTNVWISIIYSMLLICFLKPQLLAIPIYSLPLLIIIISHCILRKGNS